MKDKGLAFSSYHLKVDPMIHEAAWGARLIYQEVVDGGGGVVWDRQDVFGEKSRIEDELFPLVDRLTRIARVACDSYILTSDSSDRLFLRDGLDVAVISPQGSYGYLYVTAVAEYLPQNGKTPLQVVDGAKSIDAREVLDDAAKSLNEQIETYRQEGWTGIRDLKRRLKVVEAAW